MDCLSYLQMIMSPYHTNTAKYATRRVPAAHLSDRERISKMTKEKNASQPTNQPVVCVRKRKRVPKSIIAR